MRIEGYRFASSGAASQCVVARRPLSRPTAASTKAPVQIEAMRVPLAAAWQSAVVISRETGVVGSANPGTSTVSAFASCVRSHDTRRSTSPALTCFASPHTKDAIGFVMIREADASEDLARCRQVKRQHTVHGEDGDGMDFTLEVYRT